MANVYLNLARITKRFYSNAFSKLKFNIGDNVKVVKQITQQDLEKFAELTGDTNPVHFKTDGRSVVPGALLNGLVSGVIGTRLPGPGILVVSQTLNFPNKCYTEEKVDISVVLAADRKILKVTFICEVVKEKKIVLHGEARLIFEK